MLGVAAASASAYGQATLLAGVAGLVSGALCMAAAEHVSVSRQRDARADGHRFSRRMSSPLIRRASFPKRTTLYQSRGLYAALAREVALQLSSGKRARDPSAR